MELLFSWNLTTAGQSGLPVSIDVGGGGGTGTQCFNSVLTHQLSTHSNGSHHVMNVRIPTSTISSTTRLQSHPLHPLDQQPGTLLCNAVTKITQSRSENDKEDNVGMFACCYSVSIVYNDCLSNHWFIIQRIVNTSHSANTLWRRADRADMDSFLSISSSDNLVVLKLHKTTVKIFFDAIVSR